MRDQENVLAVQLSDLQNLNYRPHCNYIKWYGKMLHQDLYSYLSASFRLSLLSLFVSSASLYFFDPICLFLPLTISLSLSVSFCLSLFLYPYLSFSLFREISASLLFSLSYSNFPSVTMSLHQSVQVFLSVSITLSVSLTTAKLNLGDQRQYHLHNHLHCHHYNNQLHCHNQYLYYHLIIFITVSLNIK